MNVKWNPFVPNMNFPKLNNSQKEQLKLIEPSIYAFNTKYFPCDVILLNNEKLNRVYIVEQNGYFQFWGQLPDKKNSISIKEVNKIYSSSFRLPVKIARKIIEEGESGMGYTLFLLLFNDGSRQSYSVGGAVDFIPLPKGKTMDDIIDVKLHEGRLDPNGMKGFDYYWCFYSD